MFRLLKSDRNKNSRQTRYNEEELGMKTFIAYSDVSLDEVSILCYII